MSMPPPPCRENPTLFDATDYWGHLAARRVCGGCPIVAGCLQLAISIAGEHSEANACHRGPYGTWGGLLWSAGHIVALPSLESEAAA